MAETVQSLLSSTATLLREATFAPIITGPLLLAFTKAPDRTRATFIKLFNRAPDARQLRQAIIVLKWLFALGMVGAVNQRLNALARNHWRIRKQGVAWDFVNAREVCIVTGGCSGFGHLITKGLAGKMKVVVLDIADMPDDLKGRSGITYYKCDITSVSDIKDTAHRIRQEIGTPTILINNAGIATNHTIMDTSPEYLEKIFRVNVFAHFTLIQEFLPTMLEQKKGHIVAIASMASYFSTASLVDYCCSKAAVLALHEGLNQELKHRYGPSGPTIQTSIVHPMWAATPMIKDSEASLLASKTSILPPARIADAVVAQVLSGRGGQIYVPAEMGRASGVRGWPTWLQELARDGLQEATRPLS